MSDANIVGKYISKRTERPQNRALCAFYVWSGVIPHSAFKRRIWSNYEKTTKDLQRLRHLPTVWGNGQVSFWRWIWRGGGSAQPGLQNVCADEIKGENRMITPMQMYCLLKLDAIGGFSLMLGVLSSSTLLLCSIFYWTSRDVEESRNENLFFARMIKISFIVLILSAIVTTFVPTTKEMALLLDLPKIESAGD